MTTRGFKEEDFRKVAHFIDDAITNRDDDAALARINETVKTFTRNFPMRGEKQ